MREVTIDIRDVALKFLAYRSHTTVEVRRHLAQKGFDGEAIDEVIKDFLDYGYLDDEKYCKQYFDYAFSKGKGKRVVFAELREKGIDSDIIQFAFEDWEDGYDEKRQAWEEASKVLRMAGIEVETGGGFGAGACTCGEPDGGASKFGAADTGACGEPDGGEDMEIAEIAEISEKLLAKVARRLQSKGYSSDTIYSVIGELRR